jgi:hypothetical protein
VASFAKENLTEYLEKHFRFDACTSKIIHKNFKYFWCRRGVPVSAHRRLRGQPVVDAGLSGGTFREGSDAPEVENVPLPS